jgi:MarR family transcriptional repressor of mepA
MNEASDALPSSLELLRWIGWAQRKAGEDWIRERDLTHEQGFVLGYLVRSPGAIQRDIAAISRGLIERRTIPGDERSKRVFATPAGAELISGFAEAITAADETILAPLDASERATLHALLQKITAELPEPTRS